MTSHLLLEGLAELLHGAAAIIAAVLFPVAAVKVAKSWGAAFSAESKRKGGDGR